MTSELSRPGRAADPLARIAAPALADSSNAVRATERAGRCDRLIAAVQVNCDITDARHARNMTMCTYLLAMREQCRWQRGYTLDAALPRAEVGAWLSEREAQWDDVAHGDYRPLPIDGALVEPFAVAAINAALVPRGWVYGAGIGRFGKPQFFLAELERDEWRDGARVLVAGREHARDLAPAPAALRADTIYVRTDVLRRLLWERATLWTQRRAGGAFKAVLDACSFADDPMPALERMVEAETETLILHELGEHAAGVALSPAWERMLDGFVERRAELFARAARDHLADCTVTLPALVARGAPASIHLWFAGLDGLRAELFPRARDAYESWWRGGDGDALVAAAADGTMHWKRVCDTVLALAGRGGSDAEHAIAALATAGAMRL
jgi:hypothetical protein